MLSKNSTKGNDRFCCQYFSKGSSTFLGWVGLRRMVVVWGQERQKILRRFDVYNKMKKIKLQRKQEEICPWGSEQEIEKDTLLPLTKKRGMLPDIGLKHKFPSMDLNQIHKKHKKNRHKEEINRLAQPKRLKTESFDEPQHPMFRPKNNGIRLFPSLPMLLSPHLKKISHKQSQPTQKPAPQPEPTVQPLDFKKYEENEQLSFKLLSSKQNIEQIEHHNPQSIQKRQSKSTLKVKTIQIINKDIKRALKGNRVQPVSVNLKRNQSHTKEENSSRLKSSQEEINNLLSMKQNFMDNQSEFNDQTIFLKHPEAYHTETNSPKNLKKGSNTDRFRLIIK